MRFNLARTAIALIGAIFVHAAVAPTPASAGGAADAALRRPFIVNGETAKGEVLTVGIYYADKFGDKICTGVVVARNIVLTAGHCACGFTETYIVTGVEKMPLSEYQERTRRLRSDVLRGLPVARFPSNDTSWALQRAPIPFDIFQWAHGYRPGSDLALLVIEKSLCGNQRACAEGYERSYWDLRNLLTPGTKLKTVGYGRTETNGLGERRLAEVPILTANCLARRFGQDCAAFKEMILSDRLGHKDSCDGDSGGPVFLRAGDKWLLVAITSRGTPGLVPGAGKCGGGGIYTLLGRNTIRNWIQSNVAMWSKKDPVVTPEKNAAAAPQGAPSKTPKSEASPFGDLSRSEVEWDPATH